jgi:hypoxia induced protein
MGSLTYIIIGVMIATLVTLLSGVAFMVINGKTNAKQRNKLMALRVALQGIAIALLGVLFFLMNS